MHWLDEIGAPNTDQAKYNYLMQLHDVSVKALDEIKKLGYKVVKKQRLPDNIPFFATTENVPPGFYFLKQLQRLMLRPEYKKFGAHPEYLVDLEAAKRNGGVLADTVLFPIPTHTAEKIAPAEIRPAGTIQYTVRSPYVLQVRTLPEAPYWITIYNNRSGSREKKVFSTAAQMQDYIKENAGHLQRRSGNEFLDTSTINGMHWLDEIDMVRAQRMGDPVSPGISDRVKAKILAAYAAEKGGGGGMTKELAMTDPKYVARVKEVNKIIAAMKRQGIRNDILQYIVYQAYHETNGFTDPKYTRYNNPTGIKYAKQKGATMGANGYAYFDNLNSWAAAMKHEITKGANAEGAGSMQEYVQRLKKNGYFEDSVENYFNGLSRGAVAINKKPEVYKQALADNVAHDKKFRKELKDIGKDNFISKHPIWTGVIAAALGITIIKSVTR